MDKLNIKCICRVCLLETDYMLPLFKENESVPEFTLDILQRSVNFEFSTNINTPKQICSNCFSKAKDCISFQEQCRKSEKLFQNYLRRKSTRPKLSTKNSVKTESLGDVSELEDEHLVSEPDVDDSVEFNNDRRDETSGKESVSNTFTNPEIKTEHIDNALGETIDIIVTKQTYANVLKKPAPVKRQKGKVDLQCIMCKKSFNDMTIFAAHLKTHSATEIKKSNISHKRNMTTSDKVKEPSFEDLFEVKFRGYVKDCQQCGKRCLSSIQYQNHMRCHKPKLQTVRPLCTVCGKTFSNTSNLTVHQRTHTGERSYKCTYCDKTFVEWANVKSHEITHKGDRCYVCHICGKNYLRRQHLRYHMQSHTGYGKPVLCPVCNKEFRNNHALTKHLVAHSNEKNFPCDRCGKSFSRSSVLRTHHKIHTGERPHGCSVCGKRFLQKHVLQSHMKTHDASRKKTVSESDIDSNEMRISAEPF